MTFAVDGEEGIDEFIVIVIVIVKLGAAELLDLRLSSLNMTPFSVLRA